MIGKLRIQTPEEHDAAVTRSHDVTTDADGEVFYLSIYLSFYLSIHLCLYTYLHIYM